MEEVVGDILPPTPPTPSVKEDKLGIGYGILSVVCPIVGWVLWAQWRKRRLDEQERLLYVVG